jgi:hypothetical protein
MLKDLPDKDKKEIREYLMSAAKSARSRSKMHFIGGFTSGFLLNAALHTGPYPFLKNFMDFYRNIPGSFLPLIKSLPQLPGGIFAYTKDMVYSSTSLLPFSLIIVGVPAISFLIAARSRMKERSIKKTIRALDANNLRKLSASEHCRLQKLMQFPDFHPFDFESTLASIMIGFCLISPIVPIFGSLRNPAATMRDLDTYTSAVREQYDALKDKNTDTYSLLMAAYTRLTELGLQTRYDYNAFSYSDTADYKDIGGYFGADLLSGNGTCRHLTGYFVDLLKEFGITSYSVPISLGNHEELTINDHISKFWQEETHNGVASGDINHTMVRIPDFSINDNESGELRHFRDVYYDPTNRLFAVHISPTLIRVVSPYVKFKDSVLPPHNIVMSDTTTHNAFNYPTEEPAHIYDTDEYYELENILTNVNSYEYQWFLIPSYNDTILRSLDELPLIEKRLKNEFEMNDLKMKMRLYAPLLKAFEDFNSQNEPTSSPEAPTNELQEKTEESPAEIQQNLEDPSPTPASVLSQLKAASPAPAKSSATMPTTALQPASPAPAQPTDTPSPVPASGVPR